MTDSDAISLMADLGPALESGAMGICLQPKFDLRRGAVTGAEVLARWSHATRGPVAPDTFVALAERGDAIGPLTLWALRMAVAAQKRLRAAGCDMALAVNFSARVIGDSALIEAACAALREAEGQIDLEITETACVGDEALSCGHIEALIEAGARISIDDYGRGASYAHLRRIRAHELKIDKALIEPILSAPAAADRVKTAIALAHSLGMLATAEGVEDEATLAALAAMGCDCVQGFLIGKPMPEAEFAERYAPKLPAELV